MTALASRRTCHVVETKFWLPIGTVEAWEAAQRLDLDAVLTRK